MFRKLPVFILLTTSAATLLFAQKTPETPKPTERQKILTFQTDGGYLGIEPREVTRENFAKFGLSEVRGVAVGNVSEDSPAAAAGIKTGDVIVKFDGQELSSVRKLMRIMSEVAPDHKARLTIFRGGAEQEITVTVGRREFPKVSGELNFPEMPSFPQMKELPKIQIEPSDDGVFGWSSDGKNSFVFGSQRRLGVKITSLTKQLGDYFGVVDGKGVLITEVAENGPASKAGLRAGDVIVELDGKETATFGDLMKALGGEKGGEVQVTVVRERNRQTFSLTPEKSEGKTFKLLEKTTPMNFRMKMPLVPPVILNRSI